MAGIVNKVYCSSSGSLILGVQIVHISKGEGKLTLSNTNTICYVPLPLSSSPQLNYFAVPQFFPFFLPLSQSTSFLYPLNFVLISKSGKQMIKKGKKKVEKN